MKLGFILEDHAGAQDWLRDVLKEVFPEISVTVANRLTEARDKLSHLQQADLEPDIALIDLSLPDGNGIELVQWIQKHSPATPVAVITAYGNMDTAIAIRTAVIKSGELHIQAGAGVVYDSQPNLEWKETMNKGRAVSRAVAMAEAGLGSTQDRKKAGHR